MTVDPKDFSILIVDDEDMLRESIAFDLKRKGFQVLTASNGSEAYETLRHQSVHLILSDLRMPQGGGIELLERLRSSHARVPPIIFVTGFSDLSEADCLSKGASKVIAKPFDRKELFNSILEVLEQRFSNNQESV